MAIIEGGNQIELDNLQEKNGGDRLGIAQITQPGGSPEEIALNLSISSLYWTRRMNSSSNLSGVKRSDRPCEVTTPSIS